MRVNRGVVARALWRQEGGLNALARFSQGHVEKCVRVSSMPSRVFLKEGW